MLKSIAVLNKVRIFVKQKQTNTMKTRNEILDFLEAQQQENNQNTNQLHLIIQTLTTFLEDDQLQEIENLFNQFKN
jgi:archaellum biogenesis ATPase FlaH